MGKIGTIAAVAVLVSGAMAGATEREYQGTFYYYDSERIELEIVAGEISVGLLPGEELSIRAAFEAASGVVETSASPLTANVWRVRLDPMPPADVNVQNTMPVSGNMTDVTPGQVPSGQYSSQPVSGSPSRS